MNPDSTQAGYDRLEELLVKTSRTFALSIPVLPEPTRREVTIAYLLFRIADTLEDATAWSAAVKLDELERFAVLLREPAVDATRALAARWSADPPLEHEGYLQLLSHLPAVVGAMQDVAPEAREAIRLHTLRTIERMASFVKRANASRGLELRDVAELRDYCYAVAGIVGEMLTELFLRGRPGLAPIAAALRANASSFGEALQLVNILKDSASDADEGRRYLPAAVDRSEVFALARADLDKARSYVLTLQQVGADRGLVAFTALPVLLARATLDRVERDGPGAKLTRVEVARIALSLDRALTDDSPAVP